jgi:hypothetical protein
MSQLVTRAVRDTLIHSTDPFKTVDLDAQIGNNQR